MDSAYEVTEEPDSAELMPGEVPEEMPPVYLNKVRVGFRVTDTSQAVLATLTVMGLGMEDENRTLSIRIYGIRTFSSSENLLQLSIRTYENAADSTDPVALAVDAVSLEDGGFWYKHTNNRNADEFDIQDKILWRVIGAGDKNNEFAIRRITDFYDPTNPEALVEVGDQYYVINSAWGMVSGDINTQGGDVYLPDGFGEYLGRTHMLGLGALPTGFDHTAIW